MLSNLELMELHAAVLFRYDETGRMLCPNEPSPDEPAPRLFLGRTKDGNIWRFRYDLSEALTRHLETLLRQEPVSESLDEPPAVLPRLISTLEEQAPVVCAEMGPAWQFPEIPETVPRVVAITDDNADLLRKYFPWAEEELTFIFPCSAVVVDGDGVSLCFSSRSSREAAEAGVVSAEAFRGRGFASCAVAAWARAVRESGRVPLYSTSWDNHASRAVAGKLRLVLYGAELSVT